MCTEASPGGLVAEVGDRVREEGDRVPEAEVEAEVEEEELDVELRVGGEDSGDLSLALSLGRGLRAQLTLPPHRLPLVSLLGALFSSHLMHSQWTSSASSWMKMSCSIS